MKRKPAWKLPGRKARGWRAIFVRTSRTKRPNRFGRKAKAFATANRRAWFGILIGLIVGMGLFALILSVPPRILPEQLAAAVRAQKSRGFESGAFKQSNSTKPAETLSNSSVLAVFARNSASGKQALDPQSPARYQPVSFEQLSAFTFSVTDRMLDPKQSPREGSQQILTQIPEEVRALDQKEVSVRGFMLPMKLEGKLTTEFLLLKNQGLCCYGKPPKITEWVNVRMIGKGVRTIMDEPITVCGTFHVGDVRENGDLLGVYRLDADLMRDPGK